MARHNNVNWNLPEKPMDWQHVIAALLMDIRDRLDHASALRHLNCGNFLGIPGQLATIAKNTRPRRRRRRKAR